MDREETRTHRKRVPKKFGTRFVLYILDKRTLIRYICSGYHAQL